MALTFGEGVWSKKKVLIVVRTYPTPATRGVEVSCTAAITENREWLRLFPIPYRLLKPEQRFHKYQWVQATLRKASSDTRPESYNVDLDTLKPLDERIPTDHRWRLRKEFLAPLQRASLEVIMAERDQKKFPTLGFFKPKRIRELIVEADPSGSDWTPEQRAKLQREADQGKLFEPESKGPTEELEKIPYVFKYEFECDDPSCHGHTTSCTDWEMGAAYRKWRTDYGNKWEEKFRRRFEREMIERFDTHFYVGTVHVHPDVWIIVGLFWPLLSSSDHEPLTLF